MTHALWMPLYWGDYFSDTLELSTFQHGCYLLLIGAYWQRGGPLPDEPEALARICRTSCDKLARYGNPVLARFHRKDGLLHHKRIDLELLRSSKRQAVAIANGRAGGLAKGKLPHHTNTTPKEDNPPIPPLKGGRVRNDLNGHSKDFDAFYAAYPRHVGRRAAEKAYKAALSRGEVGDILAGAMAYAASVKGKEAQYIAHPATWLNADRWLDQGIAPTQRLSDAEIEANRIRREKLYGPQRH